MARILTVTLNPALDLTLGVDHLLPGEVHRVATAQRHAAGKGVNVAQALSDLGHEVVVTGFLGDQNADAFDTLFARRGWTDAFVRVPGETRTNIKVVEAQGRNTDLNSPGFVVPADGMQALLARLDEWSAQVDAILMCGSLPAGLDMQWWQQAIERLIQRHPRVAVDTSGAALIAAVAAKPWLIKPNTQELLDAFGSTADAQADWRDVAARLVAQGVGHVVVSDGAAGVSWWSDRGVWQATPPAVTVRSTVGAGDTLLAAMVHGLLRDDAPGDTLTFAAACGTYAVTHVGFGLDDARSLAEIESGVTVVSPPASHTSFDPQR